MWLHNILLELQVRLSLSPIILCDNVGATYLMS
ncbi:hypothetical protein GLYMA_07G168751v4 [Glycine max]|nr:hypothetical protein GLYMA_07G168751v4 [Glycine max]KAH1087220.1 hypothetical protein GYH30_018667 [Glycine max]